MKSKRFIFSNLTANNLLPLEKHILALPQSATEFSDTYEKVEGEVSDEKMVYCSLLRNYCRSNEGRSVQRKREKDLLVVSGEEATTVDMVEIDDNIHKPEQRRNKTELMFETERERAATGEN